MPSRVAIWLLVSVGTLAAQQSQPDPKQTVRTFRFAATYAKGQPVADLRLAEIRISEAGKSDPVAFLRFPPVQEPKSTLILLDLFNADFTAQSNVCQELIRTLAQMPSTANVYLFLLAPDTSLFTIHTWTTPESPWTGLLKQGLQTVGKLKHANSMDANAAANMTYQALKALGAQFAMLPGDKRLIWITRGMPLMLTGPGGPPPLIFQTLLQQTVTEFRQFGIPIYTVHQNDRATANVDRNEALDSLASLTGGRSFANEAVGRAIAEAQIDADATYLAGYDPAVNAADGKFHEFRVSTTRKGVRILAPLGYTAQPLNEIAQTALSQAVLSAFDRRDLGLRVTTDTAGNTTHIQIYVAPNDLLLKDTGGVQTGSLLLSFVYFNSDGQRTATEPVNINVKLTSDEINAAVKTGYPIEVDQNFPAGASKVRIIVQDAATAITGSFSIPIAN